MTSVKARHSADDRKGPRTSSPFRSKVETTRLVAAQQMVIKRLEEVVALEREIGRASGAERRRLTTRLTATRNNLRSWQDYIAKNTPREPRAVITPAA